MTLLSAKGSPCTNPTRFAAIFDRHAAHIQEPAAHHWLLLD
ncbi:MAG TPA: hypothetical protein VGP26_10235 [Actinophytocola sp.]|jgi:hypothetical protein|nr:hypothetical protein [Actinophytocola sp.]